MDNHNAKLRQYAMELKHNEALAVIMADMQQDLLNQFETISPDELVGLQQRYVAIDALRSAIADRVTVYLETA